MIQPWFEPTTFGTWYGALVGGGGGTLIGILGGIVGGVLVPRGIGRRAVSIGIGVLVVLGLAQIALGLVALLNQQPYGIWYPLLLCGFIFAVVPAALLPALRRAYAAAEARRMDAAALRERQAGG